MTLNWRNYNDLVRDTLKLAPMVREEVDVVVGIPRSGMVPATILAIACHLPLGVVGDDGFITTGTGARLSEIADQTGGTRVMLIDDSVLTGRAMQEALAGVNEDEMDITMRACVYLHPAAREHVDAYAIELPDPRVFEWNLFGSALIKHSMLDIDGVLCPDPPMREEDWGAYTDYLESASVLYAPLYPVHTLCTNRLETTREITTAWLARNGIEYKHLKMAPFDTPQARRRMSSPVTLKSAWYSAHDAPGVLVESHDAIALQVARNVGRPVISLQSMRCYQ